MAKIPSAVKQPYFGYIKRIRVTPTLLTIERYRKDTIPGWGISYNRRKYKSDFATLEYFLRLVRDKDNVKVIRDNEYKCLHSLWKGCIIKFDFKEREGND